eukprot:901099-Amphidinium_carterae.1
MGGSLKPSTYHIMMHIQERVGSRGKLRPVRERATQQRTHATNYTPGADGQHQCRQAKQRVVLCLPAHFKMHCLGTHCALGFKQHCKMSCFVGRALSQNSQALQDLKCTQTRADQGRRAKECTSRCCGQVDDCHNSDKGYPTEQAVIRVDM